VDDLTYRLTIFGEIHWVDHLDPVTNSIRKSAYLGRLEDDKGLKEIHYSDNRLSIARTRTNANNVPVLTYDSMVNIEHLPRSQLSAAFISLNILPGQAQLRRLISLVHKFRD
jgi:hypothetical protein